MSTHPHPLPYWAPRILGLFTVGFIALFAADAFSGEAGFWENIVAFLMHLLPAAALLGLVLLAWRFERIGGLIFLALAAFYIYWTWGRFPLAAYFAISGPLVVTGLLFFVSAWRRGEE